MLSDKNKGEKREKERKLLRDGDTMKQREDEKTEF